MATTPARKPSASSTRTKTSTTSRKSTPKSTPKPKPATDAVSAEPVETVTPVLVQTGTPLVSAAEMKKKDLIQAVVERSGVKKRDAKPAIEAALAILGDALAEGRDLNLAPLGKLKVQKQKKIAQGIVTTLRLRQNDERNNDAPDPLAQAAE